MRYIVPLLIALTFNSQSALAQERDDENPTFFKKKASEWMEILRTSKKVIERRRALLALRFCGPKTRNIFESVTQAMLNDQEKIVRIQAAQTLNRLGTAARKLSDKLPINLGLKGLVTAVEKDKATEVRAAAAIALGRLGSLAEDERNDEINAELKKAVPVLAKGLSDTTPATREAMAEALGRLGEMSKPAVEDLIASLKASSTPEMRNARLFTLYGIRRIGKPEQLTAVNPLLETLKEKDLPSDVQRGIAETLGTMGEGARSASKALAELLKVKDVDVKRAAAQALDNIGRGAKDVLPVLLKTMTTTSEDRFVRCSAIHTVSQIVPNLDQDAERTDALKKLQLVLRDGIADVRLAAIQALGGMKKETLGDQLKQVLAKLGIETKAIQPAIRNAAKDAIERLTKE